jgi:hypothetical protein
MAFTLTTPVTGLAQSLLTSPTYTLTADIAPDSNGKQWAITALGGTQSGVSFHTVSCPFTTTVVRPRSFKQLGKPHPVTGLVSQVPRNVYKLITRKGVLPLAGQPAQTMLITTIMEIPAGADGYDVTSIRAALSMHGGAISQQSAGLGDTLCSGIL